MDKLSVITKYFDLLEKFEADDEKFGEVLDHKFHQIEFPNALNVKGQESDFSTTIERAAMGAKMLSRQKFKIRNYMESDRQIMVEADWFGEMKVDAGPVKKGSKVEAKFCIVCEFEDGKIVRQRNYDCFSPFDS